MRNPWIDLHLGDSTVVEHGFTTGAIVLHEDGSVTPRLVLFLGETAGEIARTCERIETVLASIRRDAIAQHYAAQYINPDDTAQP